MSVAKKTISLPKPLLVRAQQRARELHYSTFSDYLQELIRRDAVGRHEPQPFAEESVVYGGTSDTEHLKQKRRKDKTAP